MIFIQHSTYLIFTQRKICQNIEKQSKVNSHPFEKLNPSPQARRRLVGALLLLDYRAGGSVHVPRSAELHTHLPIVRVHPSSPLVPSCVQYNGETEVEELKTQWFGEARKGPNRRNSGGSRRRPSYESLQLLLLMEPSRLPRSPAPRLIFLFATLVLTCTG